MTAYAEIDAEGKRIEVRFPFSRPAVTRIRSIPGKSYVAPANGGPFWRLPLELTTARRLREAFQDDLRLGPELRAWGWRQVKREQDKAALSLGDEAELEHLPRALPRFMDFIMTADPPRLYQLPDIKFMAATNCINANDPGLGKTIETIGAVYEGGWDAGPQLVMAPKGSLETVWQYELERWQPLPVLVTSGDNTAAQRARTLSDAIRWYEAGEPFWLIVNPDMVRYRGVYEERDGKREEVGVAEVNPEFFAIKWHTATIDEFHLVGLNNPKSLLARALYGLSARRRWADSGTPFGGVPIKLWGALHYVDPRTFSARWRWAEQWLEVEENVFGGKDIGGVQPGREDELVRTHAAHMLRRAREEVFPMLPRRQRIQVMCKMRSKQRKQYETFARDAEIRIDEERLSAATVLAEYTRQKQFANAVCELVDGKVIPTEDSCKLPQLMARLAERGISPKDPHGRAQAIIASESRQMINMVAGYLRKQGLAVVLITGKVKGAARAKAQRRFQAGKVRLLLMTTTAGGVSITLDRADSVHILDETWDPDNERQVEDRTRLKSADVFYYRTMGTIQEYVHEVATDKAVTNHNILDLRRQGLAATSGGRSAARVVERTRVGEAQLPSARATRERTSTRSGKGRR